MPSFSDISFTSFAKYAPWGKSNLSQQSKNLRWAIKEDKTFTTKAGIQPIIPYTARLMVAEMPKHECLIKCFAGEVVLVPAPKSAPLVSGALWVPRRICHELVLAGIRGHVEPLLERAYAVTQASRAQASQRPTPKIHFDSMTVPEKKRGLFAGKRLVLVDDFVTRGATMMAAHARLKEAFPDAEVSCFAFVRTISPGEVDQLIEPVAGTINMNKNGTTHREPSPMAELELLERQLARLEAKALLHGHTDAIAAEIDALATKLDEIEQGAGEDWLMARDKELGRAFKPPAGVDPSARAPTNT